MTTDKSKIDKKPEAKLSEDDIQRCITTLEELVENGEQLVHLSVEQRNALLTSAGRLSRPDREEIKKRQKEAKKENRRKKTEQERKARATTGIRQARTKKVFQAPEQLSSITRATNDKERVLTSPRNCYICKAEYVSLHFFYDAMCPGCAEFNYKKRYQSASLEGQTALITGSRLKIGYQATLMMLRAGARVIATTRFPVDSALRYSKEKDFSEWADKLQIYGLDLRHTPSVELFCRYIGQKYDRLDILINNAAQTVRRPPGFYTHLMENENKSLQSLPKHTQSVLDYYQSCLQQIALLEAPKSQTDLEMSVSWEDKLPGIGLRASAQLSQIPYTYDHTLDAKLVFPSGKVDPDLQQVDLRETNSWRLRLGEIETAEMLELQLVNSIAPFVLCNRFIPMMKRENTGQKHIVNVSAMEGKFLRFKKDSRHPHTNMAKAALNMLTHTSAKDLVKDGIFINAVDTGWVTDEDPVNLARFKEEVHDFQPPLDIVDGAARVCDPFFDGINTGEHWSGKFLKDYFPIDW
jgi:NAD(P)-dependent dehydrogenase (short-subunit alcohol dehydrogenase family)